MERDLDKETEEIQKIQEELEAGKHLSRIEEFKKEVHDRAHEIDSSNELCWLSLTVGWAIAKGFSPSDAYCFAVHIRYKTELG